MKVFDDKIIILPELLWSRIWVDGWISKIHNALEVKKTTWLIRKGLK